MLTRKKAEEVMPHVRAAVAALHNVWFHCRQVERALGRDLDGLEGTIQDMAVSVDDAEVLDVQDVRKALGPLLR
jgi:hypothetical protein